MSELPIGPSRPEDRRPLEVGLFRAERQYLADTCSWPLGMAVDPPAAFVAMHGWYRQATAGLRNALEAMAWGAALAVRNDTAHHASWRAGTFEPKFGNAVELLAADPPLAALDDRLGPPALFGRKPDGVLPETYNKLCRYAHSRAGHNKSRPKRETS